MNELREGFATMRTCVVCILSTWQCRIADLVALTAAQAETWLKTQQLNDISADDMLHTKQRGFSDVQIARFTCELLPE